MLEAEFLFDLALVVAQVLPHGRKQRVPQRKYLGTEVGGKIERHPRQHSHGRAL